jgi:uncharacterized protein (DUF2147 family)
MAVFLTSTAIAQVPAANSIPFALGYALTFVFIALATFLLGYAVCYSCVSGRICVECPKAVDTAAAGLLGFLAGFLLTSLAVIAFYLTPLTQLEYVKSAGVETVVPTTNTSYVCWWCNVLHWFVSSPSAKTPTESLNALFDAARKAAADAVKASAANAAGVKPPPAPAAPPTPTQKQEPQHETAGGPQKEHGAADAASPAAESTGKKPPPEKVASKPAPPKGPLAGTWTTSSGTAEVLIDDDGQTFTMSLVPGKECPLRILTGKMARKDDSAESKSFSGKLEAVFVGHEMGKPYNIKVTGTITDGDHLHLSCANWPKWSSKGRYLGKDILEETLTRSDNAPPGSGHPDHSP